MASAALLEVAALEAPLLFAQQRALFTYFLDLAESSVPRIATLSEPNRSRATCLWAAHETERRSRGGVTGSPGQTTSRAGRGTAPLSTFGPRDWSTTSYGAALSSLIAGNTSAVLGV